MSARNEEDEGYTLAWPGFKMQSPSGIIIQPPFVPKPFTPSPVRYFNLREIGPFDGLTTWKRIASLDTSLTVNPSAAPRQRDDIFTIVIAENASIDERSVDEFCEETTITGFILGHTTNFEEGSDVRSMWQVASQLAWGLVGNVLPRGSQCNAGPSRPRSGFTLDRGKRSLPPSKLSGSLRLPALLRARAVGERASLA
ncbi:hypothetical protein K437DRAFT_143405 [Tilletiaria anomala UBC 951]|uniref:Uncharacterized protein n=1 Tax=Tilletiaria anomala (strain ATCC 24038 / CBS 436.72 / UBC 951) TaxID=1037660 RepID=A0A066VYQ4_TILAU|nr:uncharacterized protein K437DRAFT_143405 [Tilletiaria anomala UBC 951]KDN43939.1 hypothetical protein K437DRAFT_143405 [Tilletiaria anomala UBC 951]